MTTIKADRQAADRIMRRACDKAVRLYRNGADRADVAPMLANCAEAADVLLEARP